LTLKAARPNKRDPGGPLMTNLDDSDIKSREMLREELAQS
jgi:hypothetical protein